jgi:hypothetical protein
MAFPLAPAAGFIGSTALGAGLTTGAQALLDRFTKAEKQKPPRNLADIPVSEVLGPNATLGRLAESSEILGKIATQQIRTTQDLEVALARKREGLENKRLDNAQRRLIETRDAESTISEEERTATLKRLIENRKNLLDSTLALETERSGLGEKERTSNFGRTMQILGQGDKQLQGTLRALLDAGRKDQAEQMAFMRENLDRQRDAKNSTLSMLERIAGFALPAAALLGL